MIRYIPKIDSIYERDQRGKFIAGEYANDDFLRLANLTWSWTYKWDGTSAGIHFPKVVRYQGATIWTLFGKTRNTVLTPAMKDAMKSWAEGLPDFVGSGLTVYGELVGPKIQSNRHRLEQVEFKPFDVRNSEGVWWTKYRVFETLGVSFIDQSLDLMLADFEESEAGMYFFDDQYEEGVVGTPDLRDLAGNRIITKLKWKDFR